MNWPKLLAYLGGTIALIALGYLLRLSTMSNPVTIVSEIVREDTVYQKDTVKIETIKEIPKPMAGTPVRVYSDTLQGRKNEADYFIAHTIKDSGIVTSKWNVQIEPRFKFITKIVKRDSIQTKIAKEFYAQPWFMDSWFYTTVIAVILLAINMIF